MTYLYKLEALNANRISVTNDKPEIKTFTPTLFNLHMNGEYISFKTAFVRLHFQAITFGKAKIFYAENPEGNLVHTSYVLPSCPKFPFMNKNDYIIGPCYTYPAYRGQGMYPHVIRSICSSMKDEASVFYMCVDETNAASIRGIEKAGFTKCGTVRKSRFLKHYFVDRLF